VWKTTTPFSTVDLPAHEDSFLAFEDKFPVTGYLVGNPQISHINTHATRFRNALVIRGTAAELGLNERRFFSPSGCEAIKTSSAGFANNQELIVYLRGQCPGCFDMKQALICNATASFGVADGIAYGYNPTMRCASDRIRIVRGEPYTTIAFLGPPSDEEMAGARFYDEPTVSTYPMHVHYKMWYLPSVWSQTPNTSDVPSFSGAVYLWPHRSIDSINCSLCQC